MGIKYEQFKFTVSSGSSKVARVTLPLNSTLKSASIQIVPSKTVSTSDAEELIGLYNGALYISNRHDITNERIMIPLDYGTINYNPNTDLNILSSDLDNYMQFQTLGGFYEFKVERVGIELIAIVNHLSSDYSVDRPLEFYLFYELDEPREFRRKIRRRRLWEIILVCLTHRF